MTALLTLVASSLILRAKRAKVSRVDLNIMFFTILLEGKSTLLILLILSLPMAEWA